MTQPDDPNFFDRKATIRDIIAIPDTVPILTSVPRPADMNPALVYLASLPAASGRRTQAQALRVIAELLGGTVDTIEWGALRYAHTAAIRTRIIEQYAPATARKILSGLRGTLKCAWRLGQMNAEELAKATDIGKVGGSSLPAGRYVTPEEIARLFRVCAEADDHTNARDAALIALLYGCGLRREEIVGLDLADYDPAAGSMTIHGKRGKERLAYVQNGIQAALEDWLTVRGTDPGPLFVPVKDGIVRHGHRLSAQAVYMAISRRIKQAGLEKFSPHSLRRSFCSILLDGGVDIVTVSRLAGHANVQTTAIYDRRPGETARAGAAVMTVPYEKRKPA